MTPAALLNTFRSQMTSEQLELRWQMGLDRRVAEYRRWGRVGVHIEDETTLKQLKWSQRQVWYDYRDNPINQARRDEELIASLALNPV